MYLTTAVTGTYATHAIAKATNVRRLTTRAFLVVDRARRLSRRGLRISSNVGVQVHRLPTNVGSAEGAGVGVPFHTAYRALVHKARAKAGERVLVHGASGGVGLAAVQLAKSRGLFVVRHGYRHALHR